MISKKAISPVVAVALLLVTAVVAVVGFQTWFNDYSSQIFTDTEQKSDSSVGFTGIDSIESNKLYFNNAGTDAIEITSVSVNDVNCYVSGYYSSGLKTIPMSDCTSDGENDIVVITDKGIYNEKIYLKSSMYTNPCPQGFVVVPGSYYFELPNFCVMKYEAKAFNETSQTIDADGCGVAGCISGANWGLSTHYPVSNATGLPWRQISFTNAKNECESLGSNYKLITNREWMTIARNIEQQPQNWADGVVGSLVSASGGLKKGNVGRIDSVSYSVGDVEGGTGRDTKAEHNLSNLEGIWDLGGNAYEYVDATENSSTTDGDACNGVVGFLSYFGVDENAECALVSPYYRISAPDVKYEIGPAGDYNGFNGVGGIYPSTSNGIAIFVRGGSRYVDGTNGVGSGIYELLLTANSGNANNIQTFRCTYTP